MEFMCLEKDWKKNWDICKDQIKNAREKEFIFDQEISGDELGIDATYLILTKDTIDSNLALTLVTAVYEMDYQDALDDKDESEECDNIYEARILDTFELHEDEKYCQLKLFNGEEYTLVW